VRSELSELNAERIFKGTAAALAVAVLVVTAATIVLARLDRNGGWFAGTGVIAAIVLGATLGSAARSVSRAGGLGLQLAATAVGLVAALELSAGPATADLVAGGWPYSFAIPASLLWGPIEFALMLPERPGMALWLIFAASGAWRETRGRRIELKGPFPVLASAPPPGMKPAPPPADSARAAGLDFERPS
jgi:hypothetical protein